MSSLVRFAVRKIPDKPGSNDPSLMNENHRESPRIRRKDVTFVDVSLHLRDIIFQIVILYLSFFLSVFKFRDVYQNYLLKLC